MLLQLEDVVKAYHHGIYFIFLFDHYCDHNRRRKDGLNVTKMNCGYGGAQQQMQTTNVKQNFGFLYRHQRIVEIGDEQHMIFR